MIAAAGTGPADASAPVATAAERRACAERIEAWIAERLADGQLVLDAGRDPDPHAERWYVRLRGADKDVVTVWLTLRQRTVHHDTQLMPAPETAREETFAYLLRRNAALPGMRFALAAEDAVHLVGEMPIARVDADELDRIVGGSLAAVDDCWDTAMSLGYAGTYRRRRVRR